MEQDEKWFTIEEYNRLYKAAPFEWHDSIRDIQLIQMLVCCVTENSQQDINSKIYDIIIDQTNNYIINTSIDFENPKPVIYENVYDATNLFDGLYELRRIAKWQCRKGGYNFGNLIEGYDVDRYKDLMRIGIALCINSLIIAINLHKKKNDEQTT